MKLNIVPARTGLTWVRLGVKTFLRQPLAMSGLFFLYMAAGTVLSLLPVLGIILALMIVPAATLGLMAATQEAEKGKFPMPTVLISAFRAGRQQLKAMMILGGLYAGMCLLVALVVPLLVEGPPVSAGAGQEVMLTPQFQISMLVTMLFYIPISLLFWHAPALVHWHGVSPVKSLFFSIVACFRNFGAFTLYGLGWLGVFLVIGVAISLLAGLLGNPGLMSAVVLPMALLMASMFSTSIFFTFRDSFVATPDEDPSAQTFSPPDHRDPPNPGEV
ncbi:MAG: BPSS1780 family membrane protein [Polaromonas sp.]|nr:BPSS1780 family membrane protein [Polaromonas sp.]